MDATRGAGGDAALPQLKWALAGIEVADYRRFAPDDCGLAAAARQPRFARAMPLFVIVAHVQWLLALGELWRAAEYLEHAVERVPGEFRDLRTGTRVVLPPPIGSGGTEIELSVRVTRVVWREQNEIDNLRAQVCGMSARDVLIEACIEHLGWTACDPYHLAALRADRSTGSQDPRLRCDRWSMCQRATRLRQLGRPESGSVSHAVWRSVGGEEGLLAHAWGRLGERSAPVPWWDPSQADRLPEVRPGRLLAWKFAQELRGWT